MGRNRRGSSLPRLRRSTPLSDHLSISIIKLPRNGQSRNYVIHSRCRSPSPVMCIWSWDSGLGTRIAPLCVAQQADLALRVHPAAFLHSKQYYGSNGQHRCACDSGPSHDGWPVVPADMALHEFQQAKRVHNPVLLHPYQDLFNQSLRCIRSNSTPSTPLLQPFLHGAPLFPSEAGPSSEQVVARIQTFKLGNLGNHAKTLPGPVCDVNNCLFRPPHGGCARLADRLRISTTTLHFLTVLDCNVRRAQAVSPLQP
jgi:hypothetical protein